jgi:hypothetical protein
MIDGPLTYLSKIVYLNFCSVSKASDVLSLKDYKQNLRISVWSP